MEPRLSANHYTIRIHALLYSLTTPIVSQTSASTFFINPLPSSSPFKLPWDMCICIYTVIVGHPTALRSRHSFGPTVCPHSPQRKCSSSFLLRTHIHRHNNSVPRRHSQPLPHHFTSIIIIIIHNTAKLCLPPLRHAPDQSHSGVVLASECKTKDGQASHHTTHLGQTTTYLFAHLNILRINISRIIPCYHIMPIHTACEATSTHFRDTGVNREKVSKPQTVSASASPIHIRAQSRSQ